MSTDTLKPFSTEISAVAVVKPYSVMHTTLDSVLMVDIEDCDSDFEIITEESDSGGNLQQQHVHPYDFAALGLRLHSRQLRLLRQ